MRWTAIILCGALAGCGGESQGTREDIKALYDINATQWEEINRLAVVADGNRVTIQGLRDVVFQQREFIEMMLCDSYGQCGPIGLPK